MDNIKKYFKYLHRVLKRMRYFPIIIPALDLVTKTLSIFHIYNQHLLKKMDNAILLFLERKYGTLIERYRNLPLPSSSTETNGIIWTCWFQGEENAPYLVKKSIESIRRNAGNHPVIVITLRNMSDYVEIPKHIIDLVENKNLSLTHLSDVLRAKLLATHGGLWLDSTLFYKYPISESIWNESFFSPQATMHKPLHAFDSRGMVQWGICFQLAKKNHPLYLCLCDFYDTFFKEYPIELIYFLTDYIGFIIMKKLDISNNIEILKNNTRSWVYMINTKKARYLTAEQLPSAHFYKLTYKKKWPEYTSDGQLTVYGELMLQ